jgi:hypothetical protein
MQSNPGFAIETNVFSDNECGELLTSLADATGHRSRAGIRHLMRNHAIQRFARDPRLLGLANSHLGGKAVPFRATLFDKSARTNWLIPWHQDTALPVGSTFDAPDWGHGHGKRA